MMPRSFPFARSWRHLLRRAIVLPLLLAIPLLAGPARAQEVPSGLPTTFTFGAQTGLLDAPALAGMGLRWRYAYLTGGLGSSDWTHWQPDGEYAAAFLRDSEAAGLLPVFTYYQIVPAAPHAGVEPPFGNLANAATMNRYFANWKRMLELCARHGKTVVVHIEPDLLGYAQARNPDPAAIPVMVAASGHPDAAGHPDNLVGMMGALTAMRDRIAPRVLLAWQASQWATGTDLVSNQGDPTELAEATADYFARFRVPYDLIFSEFSDRDSGYYQVVRGQDRWWAAADFERFRRYLARLSSRAGKRIVLWQIPMGNTRFATMNNSAHHYQDNRAEYFLGDLVDGGTDTARLRGYAEAGVIAMLFGGGEITQTGFSDKAGDGVTNPPPFVNPANRTGRANDRLATLGDDDGGFLRAAFAAYGHGDPVALPARVRADFDRIFDWAEQSLPELFPPGPVTESVGEYRIRRYGNANIAGHRRDRIYVYSPAFGGLIDLGESPRWLEKARAEGH